MWELARELVHNYSYTVTVVTRKLPGDTCSRMAPSQFGGKLLVHAVGPVLPWEHIVGRLWYVVSAFFIGLQTKADVIHAHAFSPCWVAKVLGRIKGCPVVVTVHGTRLLSGAAMGHGMLDGCYRYLEERILLHTRYSRVISVDEQLLRLPSVNRPLTVIPNGTHIPKERRKKRVRAEIQLLFVGRLVAQKNIASLITAISDVIEAFPLVRVVIVGDGPERTFLEDMIKQKRLSAHIRFAGKVPEEKVEQYYRDADAFVLPSLYEGHSLALLAACVYELPVIATDVGANRHMVKDGVNGYLVPPGDTKKLCDAILKLCASREKHQMGSTSRAMIARYSWANTARQTHRVYQELLDQ